jgi:hypothetical protein
MVLGVAKDGTLSVLKTSLNSNNDFYSDISTLDLNPIDTLEGFVNSSSKADLLRLFSGVYFDSSIS